MDEKQLGPLRELRRNLVRLTQLLATKDVSLAGRVAPGGVTAAAASDSPDSPDSSQSLGDRQIAEAIAHVAIVDDFGKFDQGAGQDGACYWDGSDNSFQPQGLMCQNCVFFQPGDDSGPGGCALVDGAIDPEGLCKLWVIPEASLTPADDGQGGYQVSSMVPPGGMPGTPGNFEPLSESNTGGFLVKPQYLARTRSGKLIAAPPGPSRWPGGLSGSASKVKLPTSFKHSAKKNRRASRFQPMARVAFRYGEEAR